MFSAQCCNPKSVSFSSPDNLVAGLHLQEGKLLEWIVNRVIKEMGDLSGFAAFIRFFLGTKSGLIGRTGKEGGTSFMPI